MESINIEKDQGVQIRVSGLRDGKPFDFAIVTNIHAFGVGNLQPDIDKWLNRPAWRVRDGWSAKSFCSHVNRRKSNQKFKELFCVTLEQFETACKEAGHIPTIEHDFRTAINN